MRSTPATAQVLLVLSLLFCTPSRAQDSTTTDSIPAIPPALADRMRAYQNIRTAAIQDWLPGGDGMVIATRFGETTQLHLVKSPGADRTQLTFFDEPVSGATVCPDPARRCLLFTKDVGGDERHQIFLLDLLSGACRMLTDGASLNMSPCWSNKGDRFAFVSTRRNGTDWDVHVLSPFGKQKAELVIEREGAWTPVAWSPDDTRLLLRSTVSAAQSRLAVLTVAGATVAPLDSSREKIAYGETAAWNARGAAVYLTTNQGREFSGLRLHGIKRGLAQRLSDDIAWDVELLAINRLRTLLAFTVNEEGASALYLLDLRSNWRQRLDKVPSGRILGMVFNPDGVRLGVTVSSARIPGDVFVVDSRTGAVERWTRSETGGLDTASFVMPSLIRYDTFDSAEGKPRTVPAFVYKPVVKAGPCPVLIHLHGGPELQYRPDFSAQFQFFVNDLGVAVVAPNVRGSTGYGKSYQELDDAARREDAVRDIGALLDWIRAQADLDSSRVAVMGRSYGGYLALACMARFPRRISCGVDIVGISDFVAFLEKTGDYRRDLRRAEYGDERDSTMRALLARLSPLARADSMAGPLLVIHGRNDPRVPFEQSQRIAAAVRKRGVPVWFLSPEDEGHAVRKKRNADEADLITALFLESNLLRRWRPGPKQAPARPDPALATDSAKARM